ncbi:hypothetical protein F4808DRAFT_162192 [Astrocystis sublimbata]|nr:hypothetical protein F4808DRAFT_162192 [Astrocystis sublimbata]
MLMYGGTNGRAAMSRHPRRFFPFFFFSFNPKFAIMATVINRRFRLSRLSCVAMTKTDGSNNQQHMTECRQGSEMRDQLVDAGSPSPLVILATRLLCRCTKSQSQEAQEQDQSLSGSGQASQGTDRPWSRLAGRLPRNDYPLIGIGKRDLSGPWMDGVGSSVCSV